MAARKRDVDACIITVAPLHELVSRFLSRERRERPARSTQFSSELRGAGDISFVRGITWLAEESGVSEETILNIEAHKYRMTELRTFDALASALNRPDLMSDPRVEIRPNPAAPADVRATCCGMTR